MGMKRARVVKMRLDELAAVDVGAQEAQGSVVLKRGRGGTPSTEVKKRSALTTPVMGHTHLLYGIDDSMAGTSSYESTYEEGITSDRYCTGHCHPWVRNEDGTITIGEAMGHTHDVDAMSAGFTSVEKSTTSDKPRTSDAAKSTRPNEVRKMGPTPGDTMKTIVLTEAQHGHYLKLSGSDAEAFIAKSSTERDAEVEKAHAADPVVFKGELTGIEVRKSQGDAFKRMAETSEQNAKAAKEAREMAETEKAARESEVYKARAKTEIGNLPGSDVVKAKVLQSLDGRVVPYTAEERDEALRMLKGADEIAKSQGKAPGLNPGDASQKDPLAEFNANVKAYAEKNGIKDEGAALEKFLMTEEGQVAKRKYDATRAYGRTGAQQAS